MDELPSLGSSRPLAVRESRSAGATRARVPAAATAYIVTLPTSGASEITHRHRAIDADTGRGVVAGPDDDLDMRCGDHGFTWYSVRIEARVIEDALEHRLGHGVSRRPEQGSLDLRTPAGRAWSRLVRLTASSSVANHPVLGPPLEEAVVARLLLAVDHAYRDELDEPVHSWGPGPVRRMVDAIEATPRHPFTLAELSDIAGVSVPALGACCRRHLDVSPAERLRAVRLARAHDDLIAADPGSTSAAAVADGWGFRHPGPFGAAYVSRYREPPWLTLRGPAYA